MDIDSAKSSFNNIIYSLSREERSKFLMWCEDYCSDENCNKAQNYLQEIVKDIKGMIPAEAILPSERVDYSFFKNNSAGCEPILHVDSFLFDDEDIDALQAEGKISRNYCKKCGSTDVAPINFVSHSASIQRIEFIFKNMLPDLTDKVVLDVGSRLGAILYGAYFYSSARKIIGVEMNEDLCKLQKHIVDKYSLNDRIEVICNDICNVPEVIQSANVIVFNNVFMCFMPRDMQQKVWIWLRKTITVPGTIIITVPSIEKTLNELQSGIDISSWLKQIPVEDCNMDDPDLDFETCRYVVL